MLTTKLLKLRLLRIEKSKDHLSTQDKLMLVSMERPDLSAHFLLRLFKATLPKNWEFRHDTAEDIEYAVQLINLLETELIPAYEKHARKYAWYEQCVLFQLNYIQPQPTQQQIDNYLKQLERCLDQPAKIDLLRYFQQYAPSAKHAMALAHAYAGAQQYTAAILQYEWALQQSAAHDDIDFYGYLQCLLYRNQAEYTALVSDVEYAIDLLCRYQNPTDLKSYTQILDAAVTRFLAPVILPTQAADTHILAEMGRSLSVLGKSIGGLFAIKEGTLPYNQKVIAAAPTLFTLPAVIQGLKQTQSLHNALQRLLIHRQIDIHVSAESGVLSNLWQHLLHNPKVFEYLSSAQQHEPLLAVLSTRLPVQDKTIDLGDIQLILQQGVMAYLGDVRLDKQHPDRQVLCQQCEHLMTEMIAFAVWFHQELLIPDIARQTQQLQQFHALMTQMDHVAFTSGLYAYQFEIQKRTQNLSTWMQTQLASGQNVEKMQAAWVALREIEQFDLPLGQQKINHIQALLADYKTMVLSQVYVAKENMAQSENTKM